LRPLTADAPAHLLVTLLVDPYGVAAGDPTLHHLRAEIGLGLTAAGEDPAPEPEPEPDPGPGGSGRDDPDPADPDPGDPAPREPGPADPGPAGREPADPRPDLARTGAEPVRLALTGAVLLGVGACCLIAAGRRGLV